LRYRKHGEKRDLEHSIAEFERALSICPLEHPCRAAAQANLAMVNLVLCQVEDMATSLEAPLRLYHNVLASRPVGHVDRPSTLIQLAAVHFARFEKRRDAVEGARAVALLHEAMELSSIGSYEKRAAIFVLQLHAERRVGPVMADAESSVEQDSASRLTDEDLWIFSVQLMNHFERFGDVTELQQAITLLEELVRSTSVSDDRYCEGLANLGVALSYRFDHLGELSDLEDAISRHKDALELTPHGHPHRRGCLNNLGNSFKARFKRLGELSDLEDAISLLKDAVDPTPLLEESDRSTSVWDVQFREGLANLGVALSIRFDHLGELRDLEDAISRHRDALELTPHGHPHRRGYLNNLGNSFKARFKRLGEASDLEDAISLLKDAVDLTPHGHPHKPGYLSNLGNSVFTRFERLGELSDLERAISTFRDAVDLAPHGHPDRPRHLNRLGKSLVTRFGRLGELSDLEDAVSVLGDAVDLTPHGHPDKPRHLSSLGDSIFTRFERLGELADLERAISILRDVVELTPHSHPDKPGHLNNLANPFKARFEHLGELSDLERAISTFRRAVDLTPHGHSDRPRYLSNLGSSLLTRFERVGELSDLEQAISILRDAVDLTPHDHLAKLVCLHILGLSFLARFVRLGEPSDLEDAISTLRDAVDLTSHGHPDKPLRLNSLGNSLISRFERLGKLSDLEDAISMLKDAVDLTPHGHPDKPILLSSLANSLITRFELLGELSDLEDTISKHSEACNLTPDGHPYKPGHLNHLGTSFRVRFERLGELSDLEDAISTLRDAVNLTPHGHPDKPGYLNNLGNSLRARFERLGNLSNLEEAISLYLHAASAPIGPIRIRFRASQNWISCARRISHHSLLHAYSISISLLPELAWIGLSLTQRYLELMRGANVVREAAAAALDSRLLETAVEWLEQGRSIVWGELFQLRSSYDELSSAHPDHARRLRELSATLEHASATREKSLSALLEQTGSAAHRVMESLQQAADRHRALAIERGELLQEVRGFPGFEQFLFPKEFSQLRASAHTGPVVLLNAAESRCDALIVLADVDHVIHVPLLSFTFQRSAGLQNMLEKLLGHSRVTRCDDREGKSATRGFVSWESLLSTLWNDVVRPVLDALAFSVRGFVSLGFIADPFICLRTDFRGSITHFITHFLVSDRPLCVSSCPCSWLL
jgi:tetratricopeptide (TPR) repeat protein